MNIENNIGKLARLGDVWYQVMDYRIIDNKIEYKLYTRDSWVPSEWIKKFKNKENT